MDEYLFIERICVNGKTTTFNQLPMFEINTNRKMGLLNEVIDFNSNEACSTTIHLNQTHRVTNICKSTGSSLSPRVSSKHSRAKGNYIDRICYTEISWTSYKSGRGKNLHKYGAHRNILYRNIQCTNTLIAVILNAIESRQLVSGLEWESFFLSFSELLYLHIACNSPDIFDVCVCACVCCALSQ